MAENGIWGAVVSFFGELALSPEISLAGGVLGQTGGSGTPSLTAAIGAIWETVTNYRMWRSLGWLFLGLLVMVLGLLIWNRRAIGSGVRTAAQAVPAAV